jgi:DNA-binding PadR family transcriptional regulator
MTTTAYAVLALVEACQPATPYDLKRVAGQSIFNFWSIPHTQLYSESARLAEAGYLEETREQTGRRRRTYRLTAAGREALEQWRREPTREPIELRDPGLLKLFFGAEPRALAAEQLAVHQRQLEEYEAAYAMSDALSEAMRRTLEAGIGHEREYVRFWTALNS